MGVGVDVFVCVCGGGEGGVDGSSSTCWIKHVLRTNQQREVTSARKAVTCKQQQKAYDNSNMTRVQIPDT